MMTNAFAALGISAALCDGLRKQGIEQPTPIQQEVIPLILKGSDVVGQSATGTGKTLAYLLPLMQKIDSDRRENQAVILAPTHELVMQIQRQIEDLTKNSLLAVTSAPLIGNANLARQIDKLKEKPHILVGSAGRILELIKKKKIASQSVRTIILDEADRLLDEQNIETVQAVIKTTLRDRQLLLFSATVQPSVLAKAETFLREPSVVRAVAENRVPQNIEHLYFVSEPRDKIETLRKLIFHLQIQQALVFINKNGKLEETVEKLNYHGMPAAGLHGGSGQYDRKTAIESFRRGKVQLLVASDLAARGLDIPGLTHVFNLDFPEDEKVYLHRAGRTGRAGKSGITISLVTDKQALLLKKFAEKLKIDISAKTLAKGKIFDGPEIRKRIHTAPKKQ